MKDLFKLAFGQPWGAWDRLTLLAILLALALLISRSGAPSGAFVRPTDMQPNPCLGQITCPEFIHVDLTHSN